MTPVARARIAILAFALVFGSAAGHAEEQAKESEKETERQKAKTKEEDEIHLCLDRNGEVVYQSYPCDERPAPPQKQAPPADGEAGRRVAPKRQVAPPAAAARSTVPRRAPPQAEAPRPPSPPKPGGAQRPSPAWQLVGPPSADRPPAAARVVKADVDPRFASPERTWQTFSAAMREADRGAARACLTSNALRVFGPLIDSSAPERLSELVGQPTRVHVEGDVGPFWSLRISRARERPKWVFLVRTEGGEWKIAEI